MPKRWILVGVALAASAAAAQNQNIFHKAPPGVEEKLRQRVIQFYSLYQQGKFRQAESLVAEESRDLYYNMQKAIIRSFQLEQINFDDNFRNATVLVACLSATPRTAAAGIWVPINGKWKLEKGDWYLLIKPRTTTPFGPMTFSNPRDIKPQPFQRPTPEMLRINAFQVDPQKLVLPASGSAPVTLKVALANNMAGVLTVDVRDPKVPGLTLKLSDRNLLPHTQGTLEVTWDPQSGKPAGAQEIRITAQPLNQEVVVQLQFE